MASLSVLTLQEAIIPLVCSFDSDTIRTVKVEHKWTSGGTTPRDMSAKLYLPSCDDPSKKELFLYVVDQFVDAAHNDRLHLSTGPSRYTKFREVLGGALRLRWQTISEGRATKTLDSFVEDVRNLIGSFLAPTSFEDQKEYMRSATKPFYMDCAALGARVEVISRLGRLLPGAPVDVNGVEELLFPNDNALKRAFFSLMPSSWKVKFAESGSQLDGAYEYQALVRFMSIQELVSKNGNKRAREGGNSGHSQRRIPPRGSSGRGFGGRGYGGRGNYGGGYGGGRSNYGGRGGYGRGRGRGNYGNYLNGGRGSASYGGSSYSQQWGFSNNRGGGYNSPYTPRSNHSNFSQGRGSNTGRSQGFSGGRGTTPNTGGRGGSGVVYPGVAPNAQGNVPYLPSFYAEHYHSEQGPTQEQYYGEEQYHSEQYYGEQDEQYYAQAEHYHAEQPSEEQEQQETFLGESHDEQAQQEEQDAHWLQDFGY